MAESGFLIDGSGEPLAPAVAWFDGRTAPQTARWKERMDPLELFSRTGLHLSPRCSACKLEWHRENTPEAWSKAGAWLGMAEYLVFRMTGAKNTDPSLRNGMENYLYDPLNVWVLLHSQGQAPTVTGVNVPRGRDARVRDLSEHQLQQIADVVLAKVEARLTDLDAQETTREDVIFVNDKRLLYPRWFLYRDDKEIKEEFSKAHGHRWLRPDNTESLLRSYATLNMVPKDLLDLFRVIQTSGNPE